MMAQLIDIQKVVVGPEYLTATVQLADDAPRRTSEDLEGTTRIYNLMPTIIGQACVGDVSATFRDVMGDTELAHLMEHVTIELISRTNLADRITTGRTWPIDQDKGLYSIQLTCVDDVLVAGALSSAAWIIDWAFTGGVGPEPDIDATVNGLTGLIARLDGADEPQDGSYEEGDGPYDEDDYADEGQEYDDEPEEQVLDRGPAFSAKIL